MANKYVVQEVKLDCGHVLNVAPESEGTDYGSVNGQRHCYDCCASRDMGTMLKDGNTGRLPLYLDVPKRIVSNWPGSLTFRCIDIRKGRHNIARTRYDVWFRGPDGYVWYGVQYGEWTQIVHCKRTKEK